MKTESYIFISVFSYQRSNISSTHLSQSSHPPSSDVIILVAIKPSQISGIGQLLPINCFVNQVFQDYSFARLCTYFCWLLLWCHSCYRDPLWPRVSNIYSLDLYRESLPISAFSVLKHEALRQNEMPSNEYYRVSVHASHSFILESCFFFQIHKPSTLFILYIMHIFKPKVNYVTSA